jgi:hypothetical protein
MLPSCVLYLNSLPTQILELGILISQYLELSRLVAVLDVDRNVWRLSRTMKEDAVPMQIPARTRADNTLNL